MSTPVVFALDVHSLPEMLKFKGYSTRSQVRLRHPLRRHPFFFGGKGVQNINQHKHGARALFPLFGIDVASSRHGVPFLYLINQNQGFPASTPANSPANPRVLQVRRRIPHAAQRRERLGVARAPAKAAGRSLDAMAMAKWARPLFEVAHDWLVLIGSQKAPLLSLFPFFSGGWSLF